MTTITSHDDAVAAIWERSSYDRGFISNPFAGDEAARRGLRRTRAVLDALGSPDRACPLVHVAGSKGKGSTCVFIDAILRAAGRRTGRYLSPHLHTWRERIAVDDQPIAEADFTALTRDALAAAEAVETASPQLDAVTAFELVTAMALLWFQRAGCDVAVIEVGLGGTLDATNVITPAVSVITPLDFEHTAILGDTMAEIAANKAGIIKSGRPAATAAQPSDALAVIRERADACASRLLIAERDFAATGTDRDFTATGPWGAVDGLRTRLPGQHQVRNATLAIAATHLLGWEGITRAAIRAGLADSTLPGRFEEIALGTGQVVIVDGAHSGSSAAALADTVRDRYPEASPTIVVGMLRDKTPAAILDPLRRIAGRWVVTAPASPRALPAGDVAAALDAPATVAPSVAEAIDTALRAGDPIVVVTGSLTTVSEARVALGLA